MTLIVAGFKDSDVPKTGLTPAITIYEVSNSDPTTKTVDAKSMTEAGNGLYIYQADLDINKRYGLYIDGGAALSSDTERYKLDSINPAEDFMKFI